MTRQYYHVYNGLGIDVDWRFNVDGPSTDGRPMAVVDNTSLSGRCAHWVQTLNIKGHKSKPSRKSRTVNQLTKKLANLVTSTS